MKSVLVLIASALCACSSPHQTSPSSALNLSAPPSEATLCKLIPHQSTYADARALLGTPFTTNASTGSGYSLTYDYSSSTGLQVAVLIIQFDTSKIFSDASVDGMTAPSCWEFNVDAGTDTGG